MTFAKALRAFVLKSETPVQTALELAEYAKRTSADVGRPAVESVFKDIGGAIVEKQLGLVAPFVRDKLLAAHPAVLL